MIWDDADLTGFPDEEQCENMGDCMYFQDGACLFNDLALWVTYSDW